MEYTCSIKAELGDWYSPTIAFRASDASTTGISTAEARNYYTTHTCGCSSRKFVGDFQVGCRRDLLQRVDTPRREAEVWKLHTQLGAQPSYIGTHCTT